MRIAKLGRMQQNSSAHARAPGGSSGPLARVTCEDSRAQPSPLARLCTASGVNVDRPPTGERATDSEGVRLRITVTSYQHASYQPITDQNLQGGYPMKKVIAGTFIAATFAVGLSAQQPPAPQSQTPQSQPAMQESKDAAKTVTVTGCLKAGDTRRLVHAVGSEVGLGQGRWHVGLGRAGDAADFRFVAQAHSERQHQAERSRRPHG